MNSRRAVTVVELLVVIVIIGILVALLLPAVQYCRESARRATCANRMRQLGIAIQHYHSSWRKLPTSTGPFPLPGRTSSERNGKGWIVAVLPHMEEQSLYSRFTPYFKGDFFSGGGLASPGCRELMQTQLVGLHCPSDGSAERLSDRQFQWNDVEVALTNYKGVLGDSKLTGSFHDGSTPDCHHLGDCSGLFFRTTYREPQSWSLVRDGWFGGKGI